MPSHQYRKSHCLDKTIVRSFYLHNGISYTGKTVYSFIESAPWSAVHDRISVRNSSWTQISQNLVHCFTNVSRILQNILSKFVHCRNRTSYVNFKLKLCECAQSHALGTCTKFQLEILTINVISGIVYFREIILESSRSISETTPGPSFNIKMPFYQYRKSQCLDKTVVRSSYLQNGTSYSGKTVYIFFIESVPWSAVHYRISVRNSS